MATSRLFAIRSCRRANNFWLHLCPYELLSSIGCSANILGGPYATYCFMGEHICRRVWRARLDVGWRVAPSTTGARLSLSTRALARNEAGFEDDWTDSDATSIVSQTAG